MTLYNHKDRNIRLTWLYLSGFFVFLVAVGWVFSRATNNPFILYIAFFLALLSNFFSFWFSDKIVLGISGAKELSKDTPTGRVVYRSVENLAITAGLPMPKVYLIDDSAPNAFATGRDAEHSAIALTSGIIEKLNKRELEGVIAHEFSHIGNRDILLGTVITVLVGFVALTSDFFLRWTWYGGKKRDSENSNGQLQLFLFIVAIILAILAPIAAVLMQMAISRKREFLADADGALLTRDPDALASALEKISSDKEILEVANKATAHMYISNPLKGEHSKGMAKFFMTHPAIEDRIKALKLMQ